MPHENNPLEEFTAVSTPLRMSNPVDSMNIAKFYANHVAVNISLFEIRLIMSFINGVNPQDSGHLLALETMLVSLSPELAYATHAMLGRALENYTNTYGPIRKINQALKLREHQADPAIRDAMDMADAEADTEQRTPEGQ